MSYTSLPLLVYGYTGSQEHVGKCLASFGEKYEIECNDHQRAREVVIEFSKNFEKHLNVPKNLVIELICDESYCDDIEYFFGLGWRWIGNTSHEDIMIVQNSMVESFKKAMDGLEYPEPTFNNVIYTY